MSDIPQGPGWWQASDGLWYAPSLHPEANVPGEAPLAPNLPTDSSMARTNERSRTQILINLVLLIAVGLIASFVGGSILSSRTEDLATSQQELLDRCAAERSRVEAALEAGQLQTGQLLDVDGLVDAGLLDERPASHVVALRGPEGAPSRAIVRATGECVGG